MKQYVYIFGSKLDVTTRVYYTTYTETEPVISVKRIMCYTNIANGTRFVSHNPTKGYLKQTNPNGRMEIQREVPVNLVFR